MRTIAIINQKGGCGKTTTAINLAGILARRGCRTLLVDLDPQSHCAAGLAIPEDRIDVDVGDAMQGVVTGKRVDASRLIWRIARNLDLVPSRMTLAGLEAGRGVLASATDRESCLARVIRQIDDHSRALAIAERAQGDRDRREPASTERPPVVGYDVACIDCPPSIGLLTYNAIVASTEILVPVESSFFSLQGATKQVQTIKAMGRKLGVTPTVRLIATLHDESSALARDIYSELQRRFGDAVLPFVIRQDRAIKESLSFGRPVVEYAPSSDGAQDYTRLAEWMITHEGVHASDLSVDDLELDAVRTVTPLSELNEQARLTAARVNPAWASRTGIGGTIIGNQAAESSERDNTTGTVVTRGLQISHLRGHGLHDPASNLPGTASSSTDSVNTGSVNTGSAKTGSDSTVPDRDTPAAELPPADAVLDPTNQDSVPADSASTQSRAQDVMRRAQKLQRQALLDAAAGDAHSTGASFAPVGQDAVNTTRGSSGVHLVREPVDSMSPSVPAGAGDDVNAEPAMISVRRLFGVRPTARGVLFVQPLSLGTEICIAGSFNNWSATLHRMRANHLMGVFELSLPLDQQIHEYRLVVDGIWMIDPHNADRRLNEFGDENCVILMPGQQLAQAPTPSANANS